MNFVSIFIYIIILILTGFKAEIHQKRYQIIMPPYFIVIIEFIGTIAVISMIFFGFINFKWWVPIILFIIAVIIKIVLSLFFIFKIGIQRYTWHLLYSTLLINLIIIGLSVFLWIYEQKELVSYINCY